MSIKSVITTTAIVSVLSVSAFAAPVKKEEKAVAPAAATTTAPAATTTAPAATTTAPVKAAK